MYFHICKSKMLTKIVIRRRSMKTASLFLYLIVITVIFILVHMYKQPGFFQDTNVRYRIQENIKKQVNVADVGFTAQSQYFELIQQLSNSTPQLMSFLQDIPLDIQSKVHPKYQKPYLVPNIIHTISFGLEQPFKFYNYIAYKSFQKFIRPTAIFLWADRQPSLNSTWWKQTLQEVSNIYFVYIQPRRTIGGKRIKFVAHASDYLRLEILEGEYTSCSVLYIFTLTLHKARKCYLFKLLSDTGVLLKRYTLYDSWLSVQITGYVTLSRWNDFISSTCAIY